LGGEITGQALVAEIHCGGDVWVLAEQVLDAFGARRGHVVHAAGPESAGP
jgi:hypothetical protein